MPSRRELANAIRALTMDAVQKANSGHPGAPMGMADIAEVLWRDVLKFNPGNPTWFDRDRFVLSNGHASMLLYSVLHLTGYPLSMEEIKNFRQFGSKTAGHPERELHLGIETTTGPLGQGVANAVGMALAERALAATFNRPGHTIVDHHTYVFLGDGCLMEGVSHEAASFAGMQKLGKLILIYDDNGISIDGKVVGWFRDDTPLRFEAYGWHVLRNVDGQNSDAVAAALAAARAETTRPSLICAKTVIGWGAPNKQGSASMHGEAMGNEEIAATRVHLGWTSPPFEIPADIAAAWDRREKGARVEQEWRARFTSYKSEFPALAAELERRMAGDLPSGFGDLISAYVGRTQSEGKALASRQSSQATLNAIGPSMPELLGGSADLTPSNGTLRKDSGRQLSALRRARIRYVGDHERHGRAWRIHSVRRDVSDLLGLRSQCRAYGCVDALARYFCLHARFHRLRGRRSYPPAHRARCQPANHPAHGSVASLRCGRDRNRLGRCARKS
jgi:transketolase